MPEIELGEGAMIDVNGTQIPTVQVYSEGNGNEERVSFHGYPKGTGQLIESPTTFYPYLMVINVRVPDGEKERPLPREITMPANADTSALFECPCTDRRVFDVANGTIDGNPATRS